MPQIYHIQNIASRTMLPKSINFGQKYSKNGRERAMNILDELKRTPPSQHLLQTSAHDPSHYHIQQIDLKNLNNYDFLELNYDDETLNFSQNKGTTSITENRTIFLSKKDRKMNRIIPFTGSLSLFLYCKTFDLTTATAFPYEVFNENYDELADPFSDIKIKIKYADNFLYNYANLTKITGKLPLNAIIISELSLGYGRVNQELISSTLKIEHYERRALSLILPMLIMKGIEVDSIYLSANIGMNRIMQTLSYNVSERTVDINNASDDGQDGYFPSYI